jgi:hypothetical protein
MPDVARCGPRRARLRYATTVSTPGRIVKRASVTSPM